MWTEITRRKYEREGQRYASDVTDAEWALIRICRPPRLWADRARLSCEPCWTRSCISRGPAVSGGCCRRTFLRSRRCKAISTIGDERARCVTRASFRARYCDPQPARQNFRRPDRGSQVRSRLTGGERWIRTPSPRIIMLAVRCGRGYRARVVNYIRRPDPLPLGRTSIALLRRFEGPHLAARRGGQCSEASRTDQPSAGVPPRFVVVILHRPEGRSRERCRGPP